MKLFIVYLGLESQVLRLVTLAVFLNKFVNDPAESFITICKSYFVCIFGDNRVIEAKATASTKVNVHPRKAGKRTLVVTFESDELSQVTGELELDVQRR